MTEHVLPAVCPRPQRRATRCPYCHDEVPRGGVRCGGCGARHHSACVEEHPGCATCGYELAAELPRVLLREAEQRALPWAGWLPERRTWARTWERWRRHLWRPLIVGGVLAGAALALLVHVLGRWLA